MGINRTAFRAYIDRHVTAFFLPGVDRYKVDQTIGLLGSL
jgi:hypothetical protein